MGALRTGVLLFVGVLALLAPGSAWARDVGVVVRLDAPGLAQATAASRVLSASVKARRLDVRTSTSREYLDDLAVTQRAFEARLARTIPQARVYRRYRIVFNGLAVLLPVADLPRLERLAAVYPGATYHRRVDRSVPMIGAPTFWAMPGVEAGAGMKIAILDDGLDRTHPFFSGSGYTRPPGFPKGQAAFTTGKVIAARAFAPRGVTWPAARLPFDPQLSSHATHVAGIAAGNAGTLGPGGIRVSGVAPRAYLGNYKVLTVPTEAFGLNGNAPEIAAGIEAAVSDGMDVINLSLGQPEIEPRRDLVALAIAGAAAAGVPTVAAAGNEYGRFRLGSVGSPGTSAAAITVGSVTTGRSGPAGAVSSFSSAGPSPISLHLKPDVAAPGSEILSAAPGGQFTFLSGTSMSAPHVSGVVALLRRRHPTWTPAQLRSALVTTASSTGGASPLRVGGGLVSTPRADTPLLFAQPSAVSFGLVRPGTNPVVLVRLTDAGGGAGEWTVSSIFETPRTVTVPGELRIPFREINRRSVEQADYIVLRRGSEVRRIPYWFRVDTRRLPRPTRTLARTGTYVGSTIGKPSRVLDYRYPEVPTATLRGPEQVFRVRIRRPVANIGVAVLRGSVQPRIVVAGDENRLVGQPGLPLNINPYVDDYGDAQPVAGAIRPTAGLYDVVFDSQEHGARYAFRFWVNDVRPPTARLLSRTARGGFARFRVADAGAGVDPRSLEATVVGAQRAVRYANGIASVDLRGLRSGTHEVVFTVSDFQEAKNMENVALILPNTRVLRVAVRVP
jgi:subtilisin family serine protease